MTWYRWRWWRIALSPSRAGIMWDGTGRWRHVLGPVWVLTDRRGNHDACFRCGGAIEGPYGRCVAGSRCGLDGDAS